MNLQRLILFAITLVALIFAIFAGVFIAQGNVFFLVICVGGLVGAGWIVAGQKVWWTPVVFGVLLGGAFQTGFKIYSFELCILAGIAALIPQIALRHETALQRRKGLPLILILLAGYMSIHFGGSLIYNAVNGIGAYGNVARAYSGALWAIGMSLLVYIYGASRAMSFGFGVGYLALILRLAEDWLVFFLNRPLVVPGVNFMGSGTISFLSGDDSEFGFSQDLRHAGLFLAAFSLAAFAVSRKKPIRWVHFAVFIVGTVSIPFGGGRAAILFWMLLPLLYFYIYKRYILIVGMLATIGLGLVTLNTFPTILAGAPMPIERALSKFVFTDSLAGQDGAAASDHFHDRLLEEAYASWTQNIGTFFFGTGIRGVEKGFDLSASYGYGDTGIWVEVMVQNAKRAGTYESGFWTIVAVTGICGLVFYGGTLVYLAWKSFKDLTKKGICDPGRAFGFIGLYYAIIWISLSWKIGGAFPSMEIFFLFLAWIWRLDESRQLERQKSPAPAAPVGV